MNQLPNNIQERIEKDIEAIYPEPDAKHCQSAEDYRSGARTEALRAQSLVEALEKIQRIIEKLASPSTYTTEYQALFRAYHFAKSALEEYNKTI